MLLFDAGASRGAAWAFSYGFGECAKSAQPPRNAPTLPAAIKTRKELERGRVVLFAIHISLLARRQANASVGGDLNNAAFLQRFKQVLKLSDLAIGLFDLLIRLRELLVFFIQLFVQVV